MFIGLLSAIWDQRQVFLSVAWINFIPDFWTVPTYVCLSSLQCSAPLRAKHVTGQAPLSLESQSQKVLGYLSSELRRSAFSSMAEYKTL